MKIAVTTTLTNGYLQRGVDICGSQKAFADYLGMSLARLNDWLHLRRTPALDGQWGDYWRKKIEDKLLVMLGVGLDEIFPPEMRSAEFENKPKRIAREFDVTLQQLQNAGFAPKHLNPAQTVLNSERAELLASALDTLKPLEREILELRYGLCGPEHTPDDVARVLRITRGRVHQIETKALRHLRHPHRARTLKRVLTAEMRGY